MNPLEYLKKHNNVWRSLEERLTKVRVGVMHRLSEKDVWETALLYRRVVAHFAYAQARFPTSQVALYLNQLVARAYFRLYQRGQTSWQRIKDAYGSDFYQAMKALRSEIYVALAIFVIGALVGSGMVISNEEFAGFFLPAQTLEEVRNGRLWTEGVWNIFPASIMAVRIFANNIMVSFAAFSFGLFLGYGTFYILFMNGLILGALFAFCARYDVGMKLFEFILPHGVLEISLIIICGAAGLRIGKVIWAPGYRSRRLALKEDGRICVNLVLGSLPYFILAGIVEGFVSPGSMGLAPRIAVSLATALLPVLFLLHLKKKIQAPKTLTLDDLLANSPQE